MNTAQQQKVLAMFAALDPEARGYALRVLEHEYERVTHERRPTLAVVPAIAGSAIGGFPRARESVDAASTSPEQTALLANYAAMSDDGREMLASVSRHMRKRFERQQPALRVVSNSRTPAPRTGGFITSGTGMMLAGLVILSSVTFALMPHQVAEPAPPPAPTSNAGIAYAPYVFLDMVTGCQYLSTHQSAGLAPRIAADGKTHMGCKGGAR